MIEKIGRAGWINSPWSSRVVWLVCIAANLEPLIRRQSWPNAMCIGFVIGTWYMSELSSWRRRWERRQLDEERLRGFAMAIVTGLLRSGRLKP